MKKTLLIGCGNIGFRHLQALAASDMAPQIELSIIEPNADHHDRISTELKSADFAAAQLLTQLPAERAHFDLVVIATNADVRRRVFEDLADQHSFAGIIFEKVLFQRIADLDAVEQRLQGVAAYVNCGRRGFPGYSALRARFAGQGPVDYSVDGTQYALASNAIHFLDIAAFINDSPLVELDASGLEAQTGQSRRAGYVEVYGTLNGRLANGSSVSLTCHPAESFAINVSLKSADMSGQVDEAAGQAILTTGLGSETLDFETRHVSQMPYLYESVLKAEPCLLPEFAESAAQHRLLLSSLNKHLNLPDNPNTLCPIS